MRVGGAVALAQEQGLLLTTAMKQSLAILQMPEWELAEYVEDALLANPLLERIEVAEGVEEFDGGPALASVLSGPSETVDIAAYAIAERMTCGAYLREQLALSEAGREESRVVRFLIDCLDERGYLTITEVEATDLLGVSCATVTSALHLLRGFEPAGVGACDLQECLSLQLDRLAMSPGVKIARDLLDHLFGNSVNDIGDIAAFARHVGQERFKQAIDVIRRLDPHPGLRFSADHPPQILPDVTVSRSGAGYVIHVANHTCPSLRIDPAIAGIAHTDAGLETKQYVSQKLAEGTRLIRGIEARRHTLYRVVAEIVSEQTGFFERGKGYLRPLAMRTVAQALSMHESTVSRAVSQKFVATPHGIFELKSFFSKTVSTDQGEDASVEHVVQQMEELIRAENPLQPLSDQDIVDELSKQGVRLSRRTVTKYRERMGIPASGKRRAIKELRGWMK